MRIGILGADALHEAARAGAASAHLAHSLERHAKTAAGVQQALEAAGHEIITITVDGSLQSRLTGAGVELVFNTYFGPGCRRDQAHVAALMEYAAVRFTGGGAACHYLGLSKPLSKRLFAAAGVPTPPFIDSAGSTRAAFAEAVTALGFPLIVKTSAEGEGIGIDDDSVVRSAAELARVSARFERTWGEAPLVERFIRGRELTVGVLDGEPPTVLPVLELEVGADRVYSYGAKVSAQVPERCPAPLEDSVAREVGELAVRAGRVLGCRDYWRTDLRIDEFGAAFVLEVNTLPGLMPGYSDFPKTAEAAGIGYERLVGLILASALKRA